MEEIRAQMSTIEEPRHPSYVKYALEDILIIIMCGVLCGLDTLGDLVVYAKSKADFLRTCLKSSNEDGNEGKSKNLSRNIKFAFTIFPKSAEFVEPGEKTLYHPAVWQNDKLV